MEAPPPPPSKSHAGGIAAIFLSIAVVIIIIFLALNNLPIFNNFFNLTGASSTLSLSNNNSNSSRSNYTISYPPNYTTLANYALGLINTDRANHNVSAVTLSPIPSGQQHAYSMMVNGYFSHWDVQGYKPYMRYTILNGTGAVEENVAFETSSLPGSFSTVPQIETAISNLEHDMVYNDEACCQNGHLLNIINPYHNRVSIGIDVNANSTAVYFVEDFENYYVNFTSSSFISTNGTVTFRGVPLGDVNPDSVIVYYDPTPTPINASTLNSQYQKPYDQGSFLGGVLTAPEEFRGGLTVRPEVWQVNATSINIVFSLNQFIQQDGSGVYTLYLTQNTFNSNETESLTSISLFIQT